MHFIFKRLNRPTAIKTSTNTTKPNNQHIPRPIVMTLDQLQMNGATTAAGSVFA